MWKLPANKAARRCNSHSLFGRCSSSVINPAIQDQQKSLLDLALNKPRSCNRLFYCQPRPPRLISPANFIRTVQGSSSTAQVQPDTAVLPNSSQAQVQILKMKLSSGHAIALWKKRCGIDQKKVDHLAYKNLCVLQGSGIIKMIRNLTKSW